MFTPGASDTLPPLENIDKADRAGILEGERRGQTEDADGGDHDAGDVWWVVGGEKNERFGHLTG